MKSSVKIVNWFLRLVFGLICRIDSEQLSKIPKNGPLILVGNHVNFLEAPIMMPYLNNPNIIAVAKRESWKNPLFNFLFNLWNVIPIEREMVDQEAFRQSLSALADGKILAVFPEGTRSKDGNLLKGKPGVVAIAVKSKAPLLPISFYGYEDFWNNLKHFRKTDFHIVVGEPFELNLEGNGLSREVREQIIDEIMYKIAELLPTRYHRNYPNARQMNYKFITKARVFSG
ncbi:MAG: hypothetical protein BGO78_09335 [Chloroflexi bacterium 44-23]|nr:MAG: hypothetical protein BGO78_09335 [Chloroflexi bacterium 44-23]